MNHDVTHKAGNDLRILYQIPALGLGQLSVLDRVRRTMLGMSFPEGSGYGYCCVVAERRWEYGEELETQLVVIDEAEGRTGRDLLEKIVSLKDRYLATGLACPNAPSTFVEAVRRHEGLSHYPPSSHPFEFRERWPHYVSTNTTCYINDRGLPDDQTIKIDMDMLWSSLLIHPITKVEIFTEKSPDPLKKLVIIGSHSEGNFSTRKAQQGIQSNDIPIRNAIWLAVKALDKSVWANMEKTTTHQWIPGRSGY